MSHSLDVSRLQEVFDGLESDDAVRKMTSWEVDFVQSVVAQWKNRGTLSDKQLEILERIWEKV